VTSEGTFTGSGHPRQLEFDQIQVQDWDEEAREIDAAIEEEELIRVHQEIERLR
jgi:hypothetical protein